MHLSTKSVRIILTDICWRRSYFVRIIADMVPQLVHLLELVHELALIVHYNILCGRPTNSSLLANYHYYFVSEHALGAL